MKAPNLLEGEWSAIPLPPMRTLSTLQDDPWTYQVGNGQWAIADIFHTEGKGEAHAKLLAASKRVAVCLHKQMERLKTIDSWEFILLPTRQEMVEEMRKALLEAGYTE